ncbi:TIGR02281 family clan AA aspartic protease [Devosia sp. YIM 151766]|uniref:retropepsin-like aspartic protease family protein n=1 Tax=Devosia sp. YIM 151766 TaxID=3017325 RepID=UPI00255C518A|nr:TIGR02281 family clan AA aspartic protease [Devosia sp. YIM 151766]WIY53717.1 TIGR02281 family clan AA aspartic protease [Devosia sp. YIM 151766]
MIFIGLALLIAIGIALMISADAGSLVGLSQVQTAQLVPLVIILIIFAGGLFARRHRAAELVGGVLLWVGIFAIAMITYAYRDEIMSVAGRVAGEMQPGVAMVDSGNGTATFRRGMGGHFEVRASINGHTTPMIFDTGASAVVLTIPDAEAAGIDTAGLRYVVPVSTANGRGLAARTRLNSIIVGGIERRNITAFVTEAGALETSLLGMTFLETLSRYSVTQNSLELAD